MDEIGRGTSTYDGLALAWACARELAHRTRSFTLFATHYFELTELARHAGGVANVHLDAVEHGERIVFMHRVKEGPADRSYGIAVAALAGVPDAVITRARAILDTLESNPRASPHRAPVSAARAVRSRAPGASRAGAGRREDRGGARRHRPRYAVPSGSARCALPAEVAQAFMTGVVRSGRLSFARRSHAGAAADSGARNALRAAGNSCPKTGLI